MALALLAVPTAATAGGPGDSGASGGAQASAGQGCEDSRGRPRSPQDCRIIERFQQRSEDREREQRERQEAACRSDPSQAGCVAACQRSANEVAESEAAVKRFQQRLNKSKRRLAAAKRAQQRATTQRAKRRTARVKLERAGAVANNKGLLRTTKAELSERRGEKPSFCG